MNRNFEKFEVGHWYIFTGTENDIYVKRWVEYKKLLLDHKPARCVAVRDNGSLLSFARVIGGFLAYVTTEDLFIEIEDPNLEYSCAPGEWYYSISQGVTQYGSYCRTSAKLTKGEHYKLRRRPPLKKWEINTHLSDGCMVGSEFIPFIGVDMARLGGDCTAPFYHNISRKRKARLKPSSEPMRGLK